MIIKYYPNLRIINNLKKFYLHIYKLYKNKILLKIYFKK